MIYAFLLGFGAAASVVAMWALLAIGAAADELAERHAEVDQLARRRARSLRVESNIPDDGDEHATHIGIG
jgi:hypothetical protein